MRHARHQLAEERVEHQDDEDEEADEPVLGHLIYVANLLAKQLNLAEGFRLVINNGPHACESVPHLHVHLLAQRQMTWPPG